MTGLFDRFEVIDVVTHLTEPPGVWTARMPTAVHDQVPHIERRDGRDVWVGWMTNFARVSSLIFLDNTRCVTDLIFGGVCHRFPDLKLGSVESGVGWIPSMLETCDRQWRNGGVRDNAAAIYGLV